MAKDYSRAIKLAERLINKAGKDVVLIKRVKDTSPPASPGSPTYTNQRTTLRAADFENVDKDRSGSLTGKTTRTLYIAGSAAAEPETKDKIEIAGVEHEVGPVETLNPGDAKLLFTVFLTS